MGFLDRQRGHLFPWAPVFFGAGIGVYFALPAEPGGAAWAMLGVVFTALGAAACLVPPDWRVWPLAAMLLLAGIAAAGLRAHSVEAPKLGFRYHGPVEGRIVAIDRSASDALRLTLDRVRLSRISPERTPGRVRVSLHGDAAAHYRPVPGDVAIMTAHLAPPAGPVEPGGFDFRRHAWFLGIGAVGYTRTPVLLWETWDGTGPGVRVARLRARISAAVRSALPGRVGAFAAAVTTGDRSGMDQATLEALRASNLAHLLAISGLHMGLLTGFVFAALRLGLAAWPHAALHWPCKKIAASGGLVAGSGYLLLSGGNVATERAYVMVAVMLLALLLDRRAVTLRAVAVAAFIVLALRPEALYGPGFQMSFAATTALVAVFERLGREPARRRGRIVRFVVALVLSSLVAGLATAPIAAVHFNRVPHFGLLANVLSVPLMAAAVIPGSVLAACLAPLGLGALGLALMAPAIAWILGVADFVAALPHAVSPVPVPPAATLPLVALGGLVLALWRGHGRLAGLPVLAAALALWGSGERPALLISETGGLLGLMTTQGRALSKPRGDGFSADGWLENDGDGAPRAAAAARAGFDVSGGVRSLRLGQAVVLHATGKRGAALAMARCGEAALVVVNVAAPAPRGGCAFYDAARLRESGALAVDAGTDGLRIAGARDRLRPWSR